MFLLQMLLSIFHFLVLYLHGMKNLLHLTLGQKMNYWFFSKLRSRGSSFLIVNVDCYFWGYCLPAISHCGLIKNSRANFFICELGGNASPFTHLLTVSNAVFVSSDRNSIRLSSFTPMSFKTVFNLSANNFLLSYIPPSLINVFFCGVIAQHIRTLSVILIFIFYYRCYICSVSWMSELC